MLLLIFVGQTPAGSKLGVCCCLSLNEASSGFGAEWDLGHLPNHYLVRLDQCPFFFFHKLLPHAQHTRFRTFRALPCRCRQSLSAFDFDTLHVRIDHKAMQHTCGHDESQFLVNWFRPFVARENRKHEASTPSRWVSDAPLPKGTAGRQVMRCITARGFSRRATDLYTVASIPPPPPILLLHTTKLVSC